MIYDNTIFNADCFEVMKNIKDKVFDVAFTSPPYDNLRIYREGYFVLKKEKKNVKDLC